MIGEEIFQRLQAEKDEGYGDFQAKLMPGIPRERIIGVRMDVLRRLAREYGQREDVGEFLRELPHRSYDETNLHGLILAGGRTTTKPWRGWTRCCPMWTTGPPAIC